MNIREIRRMKNITQKELADKIGVNYTVISKYESGKIRPPIDKLEKISSVLGVNLDALIDKDVASTHTLSMRRRQHYTAVDEDRFIISDSEAAQSVLEQANGICELCGQPAPFCKPDGTPHLEVHYITWLSHGGVADVANAVALCPNCHQRIHILNQEEDVQKLIEKASRHKQ